MGINAFIVEDDDKFRRMVELRLRAWQSDIDLTIATSIKAARSTLEQSDKQFTLAILDHYLPDGTGSELFEHPKLQSAAVLAMSADDSPQIPGHTVKAGAEHFLAKRQLTDPLFIPLLEAIIERKALEAVALESKLRESRMKSIQVLLSTLQHEINNPLGAVLGGIYLLKTAGTLARDQAEALALIEESGNRIKHVINQLCKTAELEQVTKGGEEVYQVPGDPSWETEK